MHLDTRTLIIAAAIVAGLLGMTALYAAVHSRQIRTVMLNWCAALLLAAIGIGSVAARNAIPDFLSIVVANTLIVAAVAVSYRGLNQHLGLATYDPLGWGVVMVAFVAFFLLTQVWPSLQGRIAVGSVAMGMLFARNAFHLYRHRAAEARASQGVAIGVFGLAAAVMLVRAAAEPLAIPGGPPTDVAYFMNPDARRAFVYLVFIVLIALLGGAAFWMELQASQGHLLRMATLDALTGLPNRTLFVDRLSQALALARRNNYAAGVMFIDLDRFKAANDTYGHEFGDRLLLAVAQRICANVRPADTVGRLGGDELGVVLTAMHKPEDAELVARKLLNALARPLEVGGREVYMTASIGIALYPRDGEDAAMLLKNADTAMYLAKQHGRAGFQFYAPEIASHSIAALGIETQLRRALERNEFVLHYQPKIVLRSGAVCGLEALLRWKHPERGLVLPYDFIPVLEDIGLIVPVGDWVMDEACRQLLRWRDEGLAPPPVSVNISARQFRHRDLDASIVALLSRTRLDPALLELELTESVLMGDAEDSVRALKNIKASGVRVSVDDFGTGYSSLAYLKRFPIDALKIDRAFIRDLPDSADDTAIVLAVIGMARSLGLTTVAEGVETAAQREFLDRHGCDEMQGFQFARPMPAADCAGWLGAPAGA